MKIQIPSQQNSILKQVNDSSIFGSITESFNLDLVSDLGKIKSTKSLISKRSTTISSGDFGGTLNEPVGAIAMYLNAIWVLSGSPGNLWIGGNSPVDTFTKDVSSGTPSISYQTGDIKTFNNLLWAVTPSAILRYNGVSWTSTHTFVDTSHAHIFETHKEYLYFSFEGYKVGRIDTSNTVLTAAGVGVFNPNLPGFVVSFLKSDGNNLWIGYVNIAGGQNGKTYIFRWDGATATAAQAIYIIESRAILAGCIVNGVPHVMDFNGRLLAFAGSFFQEVARLPLKPYECLYGLSVLFNGRGIHPNGMVYDPSNKEVLINLTNAKTIDTTSTFYNFPGGVWSYKQETGLLHKYSSSFQSIANTGTTGLVDYGQYNTFYPGAITYLSLLGNSLTAGDKGRILFSNTISTNSSINTNIVDCAVVLCSDDTNYTTQSYAYFVTTEIHSPFVIETWQKIYALYQRLAIATDKIVIKYRTELNDSVKANVTWSDIDRITTTTDVSGYSVGDELQLIQGNGSGKSFHITSIVNNSGTYTVILDDSMPSGVIGLTGVAVFDKWIKLGEITYTNEKQYQEFLINVKNISPFIKIKVCLQFTGDNEMYNLSIISNSEIK